MTTKPAQPFGRRGRPAARPPLPPRADLAPDPAALALPESLIAAIVRPDGAKVDEENGDKDLKVARSLRAALLAGLCVGFLSAAGNVANLPAYGKELAPFLGDWAVPVPIVALCIGLWSAARTTAFTLLLTHRVLSRLGWTHIAAYAFGGAIVAVAYAFIVDALGLALVHPSFGLEFVTGLGAGFFYRLFAGTVRAAKA